MSLFLELDRAVGESELRVRAFDVSELEEVESGGHPKVADDCSRPTSSRRRSHATARWAGYHDGENCHSAEVSSTSVDRTDEKCPAGGFSNRKK